MWNTITYDGVSFSDILNILSDEFNFTHNKETETLAELLFKKIQIQHKYSQGRYVRELIQSFTKFGYLSI